MPLPFTIRRARREDRQRLGVLWLQFLRGQAGLDHRFGAAGDALERWRNDFPFWITDESRCLLVAEAAGELAGFASAQRWAPPPIYAAVAEVYLDELYVLPAAQGQGVGVLLVEAVQAWAVESGAQRLRVGVLASNEAGRAFWERQQARPFAVTYTLDLDRSEAPGDPEERHRLGF